MLTVVDNHSCNTRISENITTYFCRTDILKYSFFPWCIVEWNKLDLKCCKCTYNALRNHLYKSFQPLSNAIYNIHDHLEIPPLTKLRLGLSHLNEYRFNHNFDNCINPLYLHSRN